MKRITIGLGLGLLLAAAAQQFFVNDFWTTGLISGALLALIIWQSQSKLTKGLSLTLILTSLTGTLLKSWLLVNLSALVIILLALVLLVQEIIQADRFWKKVFFSLLGVISFLPALAMSTMTIFPAQTLSYLRAHGMGGGNVTTAKQTETQLNNGSRLVSNVQYDTEVPNGFMDIYYPAKSQSEKPTTVVYIHGGGYLWGDKVGGDPNAGESNFEDSFVANMLGEGYTVVSINYALTPEHPYPTAIKQLNRGLAYLVANAEQLNLPMDRVVLSGGSAGGNLAGVLANLQTNPAYAEQLGETASLPADALKAVIFESSLLDNGRFQETHYAIFDWLFFHMNRMYLQTSDFQDSPDLVPSNVTDNVTADFPAAFVSDGNTGTFYDQAFDLDEKLTQLGVPHELNYYSKEEAGALGHGFEEAGGTYGQLTMEKIKAFIEAQP